MSLQVTRRRSQTGIPSVAEHGWVRSALPEPAFVVPARTRCAPHGAGQRRRDVTFVNLSPVDYRGSQDRRTVSMVEVYGTRLMARRLDEEGFRG